MKLFNNAMVNNSMHWRWKAGLVFAVLCSLQMFGENSLNGEEIMAFNLPPRSMDRVALDNHRKGAPRQYRMAELSG